MKIELKKIQKNKRRVGRGPGSGSGKTSSRGMNGQKSRTGSSTKFFEGGQTKLINRLPKARGFKSIANKPLTLTTGFISKNFKSGDTVTTETLVKILKFSPSEISKLKGIKIINRGKIANDIKFAQNLILSKSIK